MEEEQSTGRRLRFLSEQGIAPVPFANLREGQNANKWKNCYYDGSDLQKWLNEEFLRQSFSADERSKILTVAIPCAKEIMTWFPEKRDRVCPASPAAKEAGAAVYDSYDNCEACAYWLSDTGRRPGRSASVAAITDQDYAGALNRICNKYLFVGYGGNFHRWLSDPEHAPRDSWGNGSAMRVSALREIASLECRCDEYLAISVPVRKEARLALISLKKTKLLKFTLLTGLKKL